MVQSTRRPYIIILVSAMLAGATSTHAQTVWYVDDDGDAANGCSSWADACPDLQTALSAAVAGDQIWVAVGTYRPAAPGGERNASIALKSGVALLGGFGGFEDTLAERAGLFEQTILTGDINGDDGPDFTNRSDNCYHTVVATDVDDTAILDGFAVMGGQADGPNQGPSPESKDQGSGVNIYFSTPRLLNCIFKDNWAANHGSVNDHGGGTLINCTFRDNFTLNVGGGLYIHFDEATTVTNCDFIDNTTGGKGGGVYVKGNMTATVATFSDCTFSGNFASLGGGIYIDNGGMPTLTGCSFDGNTGLGGGGGLYADNGSTPSSTDCIFVNNEGQEGGGAYHINSSDAQYFGCTFDSNHGLDGGGMWSSLSSPIVTDCTFIDNTSREGGGIWNSESNAVVTNCEFRGNRADDAGGGAGAWNLGGAPVFTGCSFIDNVASGDDFNTGGGMLSYVSSPVVTKCSFVGNQAGLGGGAMYFEGDNEVTLPSVTDCFFSGNTALHGGAIYNLYSDPALTNCVFSANVASGSAFSSGGAIHNSFDCNPSITNCSFTANSAMDAGGLASYSFSFPSVVNSIFWGNVNGEIFGETGGVSYSSVQGGYEGPGNMDENPNFVDADGADNIPGTADDDLRVQPGSPCIDSGDNLSVPAGVEADLDGFLRFADDPLTRDTGNPGPPGPIVDLGAYEYSDCNANGVADYNDIADCQGEGWCLDDNLNGLPDGCELAGCVTNLDCEDGDACTSDVCSDGGCAFDPRLYGDANNDGVRNIVDVICAARVIFQNATFCGDHEVSLDEIDIAPSVTCGDGALNIVDVVATARAVFQDAVDECCGG